MVQAEEASAAAAAPEVAERIQQALARGDAPIKPEFLLPDRPKRQAPEEPRAPREDGEPPGKKAKHHRGQNKAKDRQGNANAMKQVREKQLCPRLAYLNECDGSNGEPRCNQAHDLEAFLASRLEDITSECPVLKAVGVCPAGLNCRYGGHIVDGKNVDKDGVVLAKDSPWAEKISHIGQVPNESNIFTDEIRGSLRKKTYDFSRSTGLVRSWHQWWKERQDLRSQQGKAKQEEDADELPAEEVPQAFLTSSAERFVGALAVKERKPLQLAGKTVLAPLTTVGNLPFRRLCVKFGVDVTVGEMALSNTILEGGQAELALLRRHSSEKCYGVQVAGGDVEVMTKVAQFIDEQVDCDFVDINCGCPLDELHKRGAGSRLMAKQAHIEGIVRCMSGVLKTKALTLKMRTAHMEDNKMKEFAGRYAHRLVPQLEEWGVDAITLHGRTARQRYTKLADWDYVRECSSRRKRGTPFIACGDVMNWEEVEEHSKYHGVDHVMIGRGALMKPWIFTEIAERRHWDISAPERLELIQDYAKYGLEHWGSDARGIETTRRFLLEWLSFTCRYVPVGVLEAMPARINWRPRPYVGRSDLETKLASNQSKDWIEISEMVLGKVPEGFSFMPKHKSNAYEAPAAAVGEAAS